jgi:ethanolamine transporter EutH
MNAAHLHLMLNHVPVMGVVFVVALLIWAVYSKSLELVRFALATFVGIALAAGVVYMTGEPAEEVVEGLPGIAEASVEAHEAAALVSLVLSGALGILGLFGLWRLRAAARVPRWLAMGSLAGALMVAISMAWTANLGGRIRHPETAGSLVATPQEASGGSPAAGPETRD